MLRRFLATLTALSVFGSAAPTFKDGTLSESSVTARMFTEANEAPARVAEQLVANRDVFVEISKRLASNSTQSVMTCARGSSSHATVYGKYLLEPTLGKPVSAFSPSIASVYGAESDMTGMVFLAVSQSGRSDDLLRPTELARKGGATTIALTNVNNSPLAEISEFTLPIHAGEELSVSVTKPFICPLTALTALAIYATSDKKRPNALHALPPLMAQAAKADGSLALPVLEKASSLYVTGRGPGFGIAKEAALKLKETSGLHAEALSAAELRHRPMAVVSKEFPNLAFTSRDAGGKTVRDLVALCVANGMQCLAIGGNALPGALNLPAPASPDPALTPILKVQSFYRFANALALRNGKDPDAPPFLKKVTVTV